MKKIIRFYFQENEVRLTKKNFFLFFFQKKNLQVKVATGTPGTEFPGVSALISAPGSPT